MCNEYKNLANRRFSFRLKNENNPTNSAVVHFKYVLHGTIS